MPAPKGNTNGAKAWFKGEGEEKSLKKFVRMPESLNSQLEETLKPDETFSDFVREAIAAEVKRRKS